MEWVNGFADHQLLEAASYSLVVEEVAGNEHSVRKPKSLHNVATIIQEIKQPGTLQCKGKEFILPPKTQRTRHGFNRTVTVLQELCSAWGLKRHASVMKNLKVFLKFYLKSDSNLMLRIKRRRMRWSSRSYLCSILVLILVIWKISFIQDMYFGDHNG